MYPVHNVEAHRHIEHTVKVSEVYFLESDGSLIPFPVLKLVENPRKVEILFEMLNSLLPFGIGRSPRLAGVHVVPPHCNR